MHRLWSRQAGAVPYSQALQNELLGPTGRLNQEKKKASGALVSVSDDRKALNEWFAAQIRQFPK